MTLSFFPISTLTPEECANFEDRFSALSADESSILTSADVSAFIRERLGMDMGLPQEKLAAIARIIAEIVLGISPSSTTVERIMKSLNVEIGIATEIAKKIDEGIFEPRGVSLAVYRGLEKKPPVLVNRQGEEGLRYPDLESLISDMADMTPAQRETFLNDAMPFNRIFVLQAYSQLKMKTDASGMPLSFRTLVAQEIPTFRTQDWIDLIRVDPDAIDEPAIWSTLQRTALGAMLQGRDGAGRREIATELEAAPEDAQTIALSPKTGETIDALAQAGVLPSTHTVAAGRVMYFLCIGTLQPNQAVVALEKIGLPLASAEQVATKLSALLPMAPAPEPPTQQQPAQLNVPSYASRNIIDLRNRPTL